MDDRMSANNSQLEGLAVQKCPLSLRVYAFETISELEVK